MPLEQVHFTIDRYHAIPSLIMEDDFFFYLGDLLFQVPTFATFHSYFLRKVR